MADLSSARSNKMRRLLCQVAIVSYLVVLLGTTPVLATGTCPPGSLCQQQQQQTARRLLQSRATVFAGVGRRLLQEGDADGAVEHGSSRWQLDSSHHHDPFHRRMERINKGWADLSDSTHTHTTMPVPATEVQSSTDTLIARVLAPPAALGSAPVAE